MKNTTNPITPELKQAFLRNTIVMLAGDRDSRDLKAKQRHTTPGKVVYTCPECYNTVATYATGLEIECLLCRKIMII